MLSDYPGKGGRAGYAVGLDTYASVAEIAARLAAEGYALEAPPPDLAHRLTLAPALPLAAYRDALARLPAAFRRSVEARWGDAGGRRGAARRRVSLSLI